MDERKTIRCSREEAIRILEAKIRQRKLQKDRDRMRADFKQKMAFIRNLLIIMAAVVVYAFWMF